jgi:ABC-type antimicrobial peptide transport system permease subunit
MNYNPYSSFESEYSEILKRESGEMLFLGIIGFFLGILVLVAWFMAVGLLVGNAKEKGSNKLGTLWFVGIFASPIVLGLYVLSLPDKNIIEVEPLG